MAFFNSLNVDLNDKTYYPVDIYEQTLENPNLDVSSACVPCQDSLNEYADQVANEILESLAI